MDRRQVEVLALEIGKLEDSFCNPRKLKLAREHRADLKAEAQITDSEINEIIERRT